MKEDLLKIINHYGIKAQLKYFQSEVFELNEAIIQREYPAFRKNEDLELLEKKHIAEEIADVLVMLNQFIEYYDLNKVEITTMCERKIKRQLERIENEGE